MKTLGLKMVSLFFLIVGGIAVMGQDRQNVPGDDFSLEGALELFKKSASPEEFERLLNSPDSKVNNLDLNGDGEIDYIRVIDRNEGNVHAFIIQAVVSSTESQDVAVIELEKLANGKAVLQITGDEDVYGIETIIEPTEEVRVNAGTSTARTVVNVWAWPSVQYVYSPYYNVWVSPWHWYARPVWWFSWGPVSYYDYYSYWQPYRPYYSHCYTHRVVYAQNLYRPYRTCSPVYYNRHNTQITHYRSTHRDDRSNRRDSYVDHSRKNVNRDDRSGGNRNDAIKNGRDGNDRTTGIKQRTNLADNENRSSGYTRSQERKQNAEGNNRSNGYTRSQEHKQNSDIKSNGKRNEQKYDNRSDDWNKSSGKRSESVSQNNRSSQPRESRSIDRGDRGRSSGGDGNRSSRGNGKKSD